MLIIKIYNKPVIGSSNFNKYSNYEFYNVSSHNFLSNQCNYKIDEDLDCFSETMTSLLQPPFAIFRILFACIFSILRNFNNALNKANISNVECYNTDKFVNKFVENNNYVYNVNSNAKKAKNIYTVYTPSSCRNTVLYNNTVINDFNALMLDHEVVLENIFVNNNNFN